jgi:hypothetical protein
LDWKCETMDAKYELDFIHDATKKCQAISEILKDGAPSTSQTKLILYTCKDLLDKTLLILKSREDI